MGFPDTIFNGRWNLPAVVLAALTSALSYEFLKQALVPDISIWQSHGVTILVFGFFVARSFTKIEKRMKVSQKKIDDLTLTNKALEMRAGENEIRQQERKKWEKTFDAMDDWISIIDLDGTILRSNRTVEKYFQIDVRQSIRMKCCNLIHNSKQMQKACPVPRMIETRKRESADILCHDGRWMRVSVDPIFNDKGQVVSAVHMASDITESIKIQEEREKLVQELKNAVSEIKTLTGLIPICSNCKKIRDDTGYWSRIESYIESHSQAVFSHGMCPDCADKLYGNEDWYAEMKKSKREIKKNIGPED